MANTNLIKNNYKLDIVKYRYLWLTITSILLIPCVIAIIYLMIVQPNHSPLKLGIDFTGGTILQYDIDRKASTDDLSKARNALVAKGIENPVIQTTTQGALGEENYLLSIRTTFLGSTNPLPTALIIVLPPFECPINIGFLISKAVIKSFKKFPKSSVFNGCSGKSLFPNPTTSTK